MRGENEDMNDRGNKGCPSSWTDNQSAELFKHHKSILTGHLRMLELARKNCVEGTSGWETAKDCVNRTQQMIEMFEQVTWNITPPKDNADRVPVGAAAVSFCHASSPADHIYNEPAQTSGHRAASLKQDTTELKLDLNGPQHKAEQSKKRRRLSGESHRAQPASTFSAKLTSGHGQGGESESMQGGNKSSSDFKYFVIDSKSTPVAELEEIKQRQNKANQRAKRRAPFTEEQGVAATDATGTDTARAKRRRVVISESLAPAKMDFPEPAEGIATEVEARVKAKDEKRRRKAQKKRKRDSVDAPVKTNAVGPVDAALHSTENTLPERPPMKKKKQSRTKNHAKPRCTKDPLDHDKGLVKNAKQKRRAETVEQTSTACAVNGSERHIKKRKEAAFTG